MNSHLPINLIAAAWAIALTAYLLFMVATVLIGIESTLGDIAETIAGPDRFGADGIAEVME